MLENGINSFCTQLEMGLAMSGVLTAGNIYIRQMEDESL